MTGDVFLTADDRVVRPVSVSEELWIFVLPAQFASLRLHSRIPRRSMEDASAELAVPLELHAIEISVGSLRFKVPVDHPQLVDGFSSIAHDGTRLRRSTDGDAKIPVDLLSMYDGPRVMSIRGRLGIMAGRKIAGAG